MQAVLQDALSQCTCLSEEAKSTVLSKIQVQCSAEIEDSVAQHAAALRAEEDLRSAQILSVLKTKDAQLEELQRVIAAQEQQLAKHAVDEQPTKNEQLLTQLYEKESVVLHQAATIEGLQIFIQEELEVERRKTQRYREALLEIRGPEFDLEESLDRELRAQVKKSASVVVNTTKMDTSEDVDKNVNLPKTPPRSTTKPPTSVLTSPAARALKEELKVSAANVAALEQKNAVLVDELKKARVAKKMAKIQRERGEMPFELFQDSESNLDDRGVSMTDGDHDMTLEKQAQDALQYMRTQLHSLITTTSSAEDAPEHPQAEVNDAASESKLVAILHSPVGNRGRVTAPGDDEGDDSFIASSSVLDDTERSLIVDDVISRQQALITALLKAASAQPATVSNNAATEEEQRTETVDAASPSAVEMELEQTRMRNIQLEETLTSLQSENQQLSDDIVKLTSQIESKKILTSVSMHEAVEEDAAPLVASLQATHATEQVQRLTVERDELSRRIMSSQEEAKGLRRAALEHENAMRNATTKYRTLKENIESLEKAARAADFANRKERLQVMTLIAEKDAQLAVLMETVETFNEGGLLQPIDDDETTNSLSGDSLNDSFEMAGLHDGDFSTVFDDDALDEKSSSGLVELLRRKVLSFVAQVSALHAIDGQKERERLDMHETIRALKFELTEMKREKEALSDTCDTLRNQQKRAVELDAKKSEHIDALRFASAEKDRTVLQLTEQCATLTRDKDHVDSLLSVSEARQAELIKEYRQRDAFYQHVVKTLNSPESAADGDSVIASADVHNAAQLASIEQAALDEKDDSARTVVLMKAFRENYANMLSLRRDNHKLTRLVRSLSTLTTNQGAELAGAKAHATVNATRLRDAETRAEEARALNYAQITAQHEQSRKHERELLAHGHKQELMLLDKNSELASLRRRVEELGAANGKLMMEKNQLVRSAEEDEFTTLAKLEVKALSRFEEKIPMLVTRYVDEQIMPLVMGDNSRVQKEGLMQLSRTLFGLKMTEAALLERLRVERVMRSDVEKVLTSKDHAMNELQTELSRVRNDKEQSAKLIEQPPLFEPELLARIALEKQNLELSSEIATLRNEVTFMRSRQDANVAREDSLIQGTVSENTLLRQELARQTDHYAKIVADRRELESKRMNKPDQDDANTSAAAAVDTQQTKNRKKVNIELDELKAALYEECRARVVAQEEATKLAVENAKLNDVVTFLRTTLAEGGGVTRNSNNKTTTKKSSNNNTNLNQSFSRSHRIGPKFAGRPLASPTGGHSSSHHHRGKDSKSNSSGGSSKQAAAQLSKLLVESKRKEVETRQLLQAAIRRENELRQRLQNDGLSASSDPHSNPWFSLLTKQDATNDTADASVVVMIQRLVTAETRVVELESVRASLRSQLNEMEIQLDEASVDAEFEKKYNLLSHELVQLTRLISADETQEERRIDRNDVNTVQFLTRAFLQMRDDCEVADQLVKACREESDRVKAELSESSIQTSLLQERVAKREDELTMALEQGIVASQQRQIILALTAEKDELLAQLSSKKETTEDSAEVKEMEAQVKRALQNRRRINADDSFDVSTIDDSLESSSVDSNDDAGKAKKLEDELKKAMKLVAVQTKRLSTVSTTMMDTSVSDLNAQKAMLTCQDAAGIVADSMVHLLENARKVRVEFIRRAKDIAQLERQVAAKDTDHAALLTQIEKKYAAATDQHSRDMEKALKDAESAATAREVSLKLLKKQHKDARSGYDSKLKTYSSKVKSLESAKTKLKDKVMTLTARLEFSQAELKRLEESLMSVVRPGGTTDAKAPTAVKKKKTRKKKKTKTTSNSSAPAAGDDAAAQDANDDISADFAERAAEADVSATGAALDKDASLVLPVDGKLESNTSSDALDLVAMLKSSLQERENRLQEDLQQLKTDTEALVDARAKHAQQVAEYEQAIAVKDAKYQQAHDAMKKRDDELEAAKKLLMDQQGAFDLLKEEHARAVVKAKERVQLEQRKLDEKEIALTAETTHVAEQRGRLQADMDAFTEKQTLQVAALDATQREKLKEAESKYESVYAKLQETEAALLEREKQLEAQTAALTREKTEFTRDQAQLKANIAAQHARENELTNELTKLKTQVQTSHLAVADLSGLQERNDELESQLRQLHETTRQKEAALKDIYTRKEAEQKALHIRVVTELQDSVKRLTHEKDVSILEGRNEVSELLRWQQEDAEELKLNHDVVVASVPELQRVHLLHRKFRTLLFHEISALRKIAAERSNPGVKDLLGDLARKDALIATQKDLLLEREAKYCELVTRFASVLKQDKENSGVHFSRKPTKKQKQIQELLTHAMNIVSKNNMNTTQDDSTALLGMDVVRTLVTAENVEWEEKFHEMSFFYAEAHTKLQKLSDKHNQCKTRTSDKLHTQAERHKDAVAALTSTLNDREASITNLKTKLSKLQAKLTRKEAVLKQTESHNAAIETKLGEHVDQGDTLDQLQEALAKSKQAVRVTRKELLAKASKAEEMKLLCTRLEQQLEEWKSKASSRERERVRVQAAFRTKDDLLGELKQENMKLKQLVTELEKHQSKHPSKESSLEKRVKMLQTDLTRKTDFNVELRNQVHKLSDENVELEANVNALMEKLERTKAMCDRKDSLLRSQKHKTTKAESSLKDVTVQVANLTNAQKKHATQVKALQNKLTETRKLLTKAEQSTLEASTADATSHQRAQVLMETLARYEEGLDDMIRSKQKAVRALAPIEETTTSDDVIPTRTAEEELQLFAGSADFSQAELHDIMLSLGDTKTDAGPAYSGSVNVSSSHEPKTPSFVPVLTGDKLQDLTALMNAHEQLLTVESPTDMEVKQLKDKMQSLLQKVATFDQSSQQKINEYKTIIAQLESELAYVTNNCVCQELGLDTN